MNEVLTLAYIGGYFWWRRRTRDMLAPISGGAGDPTVHWAVQAWQLAIVTSFVVRFGNTSSDSTRDGIATRLVWDAIQAGVRLAGLALLLVGVWQIREQVRRRVAEIGVDLRIRNTGSGRVPLVAPLGMPALPAAADLEPADDGFWQRVGRLAGAAGADLALLEITGKATRRWALVPPAGDLAAVRAAVPDGAIVTVFAEPPSAADTTAFIPVPADYYHGFLEDDVTGAFSYQTVRPTGVPVFLARARNARRWALYPTESPSSVTAVAGPA
ncbi:hypothetical protein [Actinoplanes regularis]|uniref:Uncharacterized protein n=1 Tax=Actinoplanes regularis TaxID=52697 RepID=A0A238YY91_9ACTN|nr:hypothetical protein [Actinoplanes regularis]GIE85618.1 hypothetical protein Are01nite_20980 [Actinoplanes regularis]SNR75479.1 hypothetical protein SAMN06264365_105239 [Actinoplanes regularis]